MAQGAATDPTTKPLSWFARLWANKSNREWVYGAGALGIIIGTLELPPVKTRLSPLITGYQEMQRGKAPLSLHAVQELSDTLRSCEESATPESITGAMQLLRSTKFHLFGDLYHAKRERDATKDRVASLQANYGTLDLPRYQIATGYQFNQFTYKRVVPSEIKKDATLTRTTEEIFEHRKKLGELLAVAATRPEIKGGDTVKGVLTPLVDHPLLVKILSILEDTPKEADDKRTLQREDAADPSLETIDFLTEYLLLASSHAPSLLLPSPSDLVEELQMFRELRNLPQEFQSYPTSFDVVINSLQGITTNVIPDFAAHPITHVLFLTQRELEAIVPHAGGAHSSYKHTIYSYSQPLHTLIGIYAHELGHPGILSETARELSHLQWATAHYDQVRITCAQIEHIEELLERSLSLDKVSASLSKERVALVTTLIDLLQFEARQKELLAARTGAIDSDGFDILSQLDEAGAWLMQDILLNEFAHRNPAIGVVLLRMRDRECSPYSDGDHWPGYRFAETLKAKMGGDSVAAYNYLSRHIGTPEMFLPDIQPWIEAARQDRKNAFQGLRYDTQTFAAFEASKEGVSNAHQFSGLSDSEIATLLDETARKLVAKLLGYINTHWEAEPKDSKIPKEIPKN
jgi:hypothetical protein